MKHQNQNISRFHLMQLDRKYLSLLNFDICLFDLQKVDYQILCIIMQKLSALEIKRISLPLSIKLLSIPCSAMQL